jgi:hypothetical protein
MKKISILFFTCLISLSVSTSSFALVMVPAGVRSAGMGGCGVAISKGIVSSAYNPAGILEGGNFETRLGGGVVSKGYSDMMELQGQLSDTSSVPESFFKNELDINSTAAGIVGISVAKVGLSVIPTAYVLASKAEMSSDTIFGGAADAAVALTFGQSYTTPFLPIGTLGLGANIKLVTDMAGGFESVNTSGHSLASIGSGVGLDIGALGKVEIPALTTLTVGAVIRDMFETINYTDKGVGYTVNIADGSVTENAGTDVDETRSELMPTTIGLGASATVPAFGTLLTSDMIMISGRDGDSTMHFGFEQPLLLNVLFLRGGWATGKNPFGPYSTVGLGINLGVNIDLAYISDGKSSKDNAMAIEISGGF